jgi:hypothetical protein
MANAQSNPMSEYDFAEVPDEISEQGDIMHVNKKYFAQFLQFNSR